MEISVVTFVGNDIEGADRIFYFMLFRSWTCESFTEIHYSTAEGMDICRRSLHVCGRHSFTFEEGHFFTLLCSASSLAYVRAPLMQFWWRY